jgi:hypothetical protein
LQVRDLGHVDQEGPDLGGVARGLGQDLGHVDHVALAEALDLVAGRADDDLAAGHEHHARRHLALVAAGRAAVDQPDVAGRGVVAVGAAAGLLEERRLGGDGGEHQEDQCTERRGHHDRARLHGTRNGTGFETLTAACGTTTNVPPSPREFGVAVIV